MQPYPGEGALLPSCPDRRTLKNHLSFQLSSVSHRKQVCKHTEEDLLGTYTKFTCMGPKQDNVTLKMTDNTWRGLLTFELLQTV